MHRFFGSDSENSSSYEYDDIENNTRSENTESDDELNTSLMQSLMLYDVHNLNKSIDNARNTTYLKESNKIPKQSPRVPPDFSFIEMTNKLLNPFKNCPNGKVNVVHIPEIPNRCVTIWGIGDKLAKGSNSQVFGLIDEKNKPVQNIARIVFLKDKADQEHFVRDVEARYILKCNCKELNVSLVDAFICHNENERYGVTISRRDIANILDYLGSKSSEEDMKSFIKQVNLKLPVWIDNMHGCGIFHRDVLVSNIMVTHSSKEHDIHLNLIDFEECGGKPFNQTENEIDAYINANKARVKCIIVELEFAMKYILGRINEKDDIHTKNMMDDMGVTKDKLTTMKSRFEELKVQ